MAPFLNISFRAGRVAFSIGALMTNSHSVVQREPPGALARYLFGGSFQ